MLQHAATHFVLRVSFRSSAGDEGPRCTPQHTATHCYMLQQAATRCNTLQHTLCYASPPNYLLVMRCLVTQCIHCNALQRAATRYHTLLHAMCYAPPLNRVLVMRGLVARCNTLQCTMSRCNTLQHTMQRCLCLCAYACWSQYIHTLQYVATWCITLCVRVSFFPEFKTTKPQVCALQHTATHTLQYTAAHYYTLQYTAIYCNTLQHCNILQHTATHCNTLQHTTSRAPTPYTAVNPWSMKDTMKNNKQTINLYKIIL